MVVKVKERVKPRDETADSENSEEVATDEVEASPRPERVPLIGCT